MGAAPPPSLFSGQPQPAIATPPPLLYASSAAEPDPVTETQSEPVSEPVPEPDTTTESLMSAPQLNWVTANTELKRDAMQLEYVPAPEPVDQTLDSTVTMLPRASKWVKDETRLWDGKFLGCQVCNSEWDFFNRRHHCRVCGSLVCHECSKTLLLWRDTGARSACAQRARAVTSSRT